MGWIRRSLFGMDAAEATFARRGFVAATPEARTALESAGTAFLHGYNSALRSSEPGTLVRALDELPDERRGFGVEGAGMALQLIDLLTPWSAAHLRSFLEGPGINHPYMLHVGAGWALARLRRNLRPALERFDPLLRWLAVDGYGFHEGYFHGRRADAGRERLASLGRAACSIFDQGLGRSLWFARGAAVNQVAAAVAELDESRRADVWSGLGLACTYAGGASDAAIRELSLAAGPYLPHVAQGSCFAAGARYRAGNEAPHTDRACRVLCGMPASHVAPIAERARVGLAQDGRAETYLEWRAIVRSVLQSEQVAA